MSEAPKHTQESAVVSNDAAARADIGFREIAAARLGMMPLVVGFEGTCGVCGCVYEHLGTPSEASLRAGTFCPNCHDHKRLAPGILHWEAIIAYKRLPTDAAAAVEGTDALSTTEAPTK